MQREEVIDIFKLEFNPIFEKFIVIDVSVLEASESKAEHVWKPGVYVFWHPQRGQLELVVVLTIQEKGRFNISPLILVALCPS